MEYLNDVEFTNAYGNTFYKFIKSSDEYTHGINILGDLDDVYNTHGGLYWSDAVYFFNDKSFISWLNFFSSHGFTSSYDYMCRVTVVPDLGSNGIIGINENDFVATKLFIHMDTMMSIDAWTGWTDVDTCLKAVKTNGMFLQYIRNQTKEMCVEAMKNNCASFRCVIDDDEDISELAVSLDWNNLKYVKNQTEKICLVAINKNYNALTFVINKTEILCNHAIKLNSRATRLIPIECEEEICENIDVNKLSLFE